jgi:hypothetical protein
MMKITWVPRRVFLAGVGAALAQWASSAKAAVTESNQGAAHRRLGSVKHIVPSPSNPFFHPVGPPGPPRSKVRPTPPPYHGDGL